MAITVSAVNAISMGLATTFVLSASCLLISLLRSAIPKQVRIASYIVIIATFVTVVDYAIQAISLDLYEALGAYIKLIVANCLLLGRAEAHAAKNPPMRFDLERDRHGPGLYPRSDRASVACARFLVPANSSASPCSVTTSSPGW